MGFGQAIPGGVFFAPLLCLISIIVGVVLFILFKRGITFKSKRTDSTRVLNRKGANQFCTACGAPNQPENQFCDKCGEKLE